MIFLFGPAPSGGKFNHDAGGGVGTIINEGTAKIFPHISSLYCGSILRNQGISVTLIDANSEGFTWEFILAKLSRLLSTGRNAILLLGSLVSLPSDIEWIRHLRIAFPNIPCGYASTVAHLFQTELFSVGASPILSGDLEASLPASLREFYQPNKHYRSFLTEDASNALPYPAWDLANMDTYTSYTVLSSRGCSIGCPHCPYHEYQRSAFTARSPSSTIDEIKWLSKVYQLDYFLFRDPCFSYDMKRSEVIAEKLATIDPQLSWGCETRPEYLTQHLISSFATGGCHHIRMGIESLDEIIIRNSRRLNTSLTPKDYANNAKQVITWCRISGIRTVCFFMVGFPTDSEETIKKIRRFVDTADPDIALVNYLVPYPGTSYATSVSAKGFKLPTNWSSYGSKKDPVLRTEHLSKEELRVYKEDLEQYFSKRNRQFYPIR